MAFLHRLVAPKPLAIADLSTGLVTRNHDTLLPTAPDVSLDAIAPTVAALLIHEARSLRTGARDPHSSWVHGSGWCLSGMAERMLRLTYGGQSIDATLIYDRYDSRLKVGGSEAPSTSRRHAETLTVTLSTHKTTGQVHADGDTSHIFTGGAHWTLGHRGPLAHAGEASDESGKLTAPMPDKVIAVPAAPG